MTTENIAPKNIDSAINVDSEDSLNIQTPDDETILELAKRRLAMKKNLFYQTMDYILILLCIASMVLIWDEETNFFIGFIFSFFWGARLMYRIFKFAMPSFKDGIAAYIKKRNDYRLESEFNRLKKEYLSNH